MKVFGTLLLVAVSSALYGKAFAVSRCIPLKRNIKHLETSCTKGWQINSMCSLTCNKGYVLRILSEDVYGPRHSLITTLCRMKRPQNLTWVVRDVDGTRTRGGSFDILDVRCERNIRCGNIPPPIKVINCTNGRNYKSNCTLQCQDGFVPSAYLDGDSAPQLSNIRESTPTFWSVCRWKDSSWDLNLELRFSAHICVPLEDVQTWCFPDLDVPEFADIDCGYNMEQLLSFFAEEYDGEGYLVPTPTTTTAPTTWPLPDYKSVDFTYLNRKERDELLREIKGMLPHSCIEHLREVLNNTSSTDDGWKINRKEIRSVQNTIMNEFNCECMYCSIYRVEEPLDCNPYCLWDGGKYKPCGQFDKQYRFTCLRCKLKRWLQTRQNLWIKKEEHVVSRCTFNACMDVSYRHNLPLKLSPVFS